MTNENLPYQIPGNLPSIAAGLIYWVIYALMLYITFTYFDVPQEGDVSKFIKGVLIGGGAILGLHAAVRGCDIGGQYGFMTLGYFLKFFPIMILLVVLPGMGLFDIQRTGVNNLGIADYATVSVVVVVLIIMIFWTGRGFLRKLKFSSPLIEE